MEARLASGQSPGAVFQRTGLRVRRLWPHPRAARRVRDLSTAARFRTALEELGGLYATFGQFLAWRADLLRPDYLAVLRRIRVEIPPVPRADFVRALCDGLGLAGERLAAGLEDGPLWSTLGRCAYRSTWAGQAVVVQLSRPPVGKGEYRRFERGVRTLREPGIAGALAPGVLRQFEMWLRITDSTSRERSYLETLAGFPQRVVLKYPRPIPELCTTNVLCWPWVDGEPLSRQVGSGSAETVRMLAEGMLEQTCLISVVDADLDLESIVLAKDGQLALRRANRLVAIPAAMARTLLKYISSVLTGNSPYANRQLVRLVMGYVSSPVESRLFDELSNLEPELKINLRFPPSVGAFESNWRAIARIAHNRPLYLDVLHRNLISVGYLDAETAPAGESPDLVAEAQWPVLGKLLRARLGELTTREVASQWLLGSGLLFLESLRQSVRLADSVRDNDLALTFASGSPEEASRQNGETVHSRFLVAILVLIFLVCLRWGPKAPPPWSGVVTALAAAAAVGLLWKLARIA